MDGAFECFAKHQVFEVEPIIDRIVDEIRRNPGKTDFTFDVPDHINEYDKELITKEVYRRINAS